MCGANAKGAYIIGANKSSINHDGGVMKKAINPPTDFVINLDQGDPKIFQSYWKKHAGKGDITIKASELGSYFSSGAGLCWFMEAEFAAAVKRLHATVGNAVTKNKHVVVGTGSSQLYLAALYALATAHSNESLPLNVVSASPYYSCYPELTDLMKSGLFKWAGDAKDFVSKEGDGPYVEVVCSPSNPDGELKKPVVENSDDRGKLIYDMAYYWPQYTLITHVADHDIMLFTVSKCTGHAGSRIGWAVVKDEAIARAMVKFLTINSLGTSKEAQLRAARIIHSICDDYTEYAPPNVEPFFEFGSRAMAKRWGKLREVAAKIIHLICDDYTDYAPPNVEPFFEFASRVMAERWAKLRDVVKGNPAFTLPEYPEEYCHFIGKFTCPTPSFAWIRCNNVEDAECYMKQHKLLTRSGGKFGAEKKLVRISMIDNDENFATFLQRLSQMGK